MLKIVIQLNDPLHFASLKKLSELDFWFNSYDDFSDFICKTPFSGLNAISLFFDNFFLNLCLFSERDFNFKDEILLQCH